VRTYTLSDQSVLRLEITVAARQTDGLNRASFRRVGLFYNEGGTVRIQGPTWQSLDTTKSDLNLDIQYTLGSGTITVQVKNASAVPTRWSGYVDVVCVNA